MEELREFLYKHLLLERKVADKTVNHYNSVIRFVEEVTIDKLINKKQLPMRKIKKNGIKKCQTGELGAHKYVCDECGYEEIAYNSYRNRHCPNCKTGKKLK